MISEQPPELKKETWKEKLQKHWMQTRLAHEGMMLGKIQEQNKFVLDSTKKTAGMETSGSSDDDMGVSIGNETHNHYHQETNTETKPEASTGGAIKALLAAALLGGGIGAGYIMSQGSKTPDFTDTNTHAVYTMEGGLGSPPERE